MIIFDSEGDGLADSATKFHIYSWTTDGENFNSTVDADVFTDVISKQETAGCHNSFRHDFALFSRLLGYDYKGIQVDTLWLSWYLFPDRPKHGLASWGEEFGYPKVDVADEGWIIGDYDLMKERCERDVKINWLLWKKQEKLLEKLYG